MTAYHINLFTNHQVKDEINGEALSSIYFNIYKKFGPLKLDFAASMVPLKNCRVTGCCTTP